MRCVTLGAGTCLAEGTCQCNDGRAGDACQLQCPGASAARDVVIIIHPPWAQPLSGATCSKHGICSVVPSSITGTSSAFKAACQCKSGWGGEKCDLECPGGSFNPCNGNGRCVADGRCDCSEGYVALREFISAGVHLGFFFGCEGFTMFVSVLSDFACTLKNHHALSSPSSSPRTTATTIIPPQVGGL